MKAVLRSLAAAATLCMLAALAACASDGRCGLRECPADAKITAEVRALFAQSPSLGTPNVISVQTVGGVVYLRGIVSTPFQIEQAGSVAATAPGVVDVQNLLTISNSY